MANFPEARCTLESSITVKIFHAVNITLIHASCRTVNSRQRMKGALCLSRNWKQSGCIRLTNFCLFPWLQEDNIHALISDHFWQKGVSPQQSISLRLHRPEELGRKTQALQGAHLPSHSSVLRGGDMLSEHGYLKHGCVSWREFACTEACNWGWGDSSLAYWPKHLKT